MTPLHSPNELPDGFVTIEEMIAEAIANDPAMAERLAEARKRLAPLLYPKGSRNYERMMQGLPPPSIQWT
jgi:hypothetical protein